MEPFAFFWILLGVSLMLLEVLIPGLVVIFLGFAAILVGLAINFGFIEGVLTSLTTWFISSIALVLGFREMLLKLAPQGDITIAKLDEQKELLGQIVTVINAVGPKPGGRIFFQDSTWPAMTQKEVIPKGAKAKILTRLNLTYIIEPLEETELSGT